MCLEDFHTVKAKSIHATVYQWTYHQQLLLISCTERVNFLCENCEAMASATDEFGAELKHFLCPFISSQFSGSLRLLVLY